MPEIYFYGLNTKSISASVFYANQGYSVTLYCYCEPTDPNLSKYLTDAPMTQALRAAKSAGRLKFNGDKNPEIDSEVDDQIAESEEFADEAHHWIFVDAITLKQREALNNQFKRLGDTPVIISGALTTGIIDTAVKNLPQYRVYYVPFQQIFVSSILHHPEFQD